MPEQTLSRSPAYMESIRGVARLHELIENGEGDSPEADAVRDRMEQPWHGLTAVEKQRITGLSEDLYSVSDPVCDRLPITVEADRALSDAIAANDAGDADESLRLLRRWAKQIDPIKLSYERGRVWEQLGEREIAILYYEFVAKN
jgi:hypothetical protein